LSAATHKLGGWGAAKRETEADSTGVDTVAGIGESGGVSYFDSAVPNRNILIFLMSEIIKLSFQRSDRIEISSL